MSNDREPDAWGLLDEGEVWYATPFRDEAARAILRTADTDSAIVALYRQPALTDKERWAIEASIAYLQPVENYDNRVQAVLRSLLERL